ncbi:MAG: DUF6398 domain-containing protein [Prevotellaceae bacterium]|jgi:hypothetical protein|nr:DUF6398 domain-containing protein [Prevotellaceae bacterium]
MEKEKIIEKQQEIIQLVKRFCDKKLNEEYAVLGEKLICKLGRKRNVPFATGQTAIWAAAVIHALGTINFLFDKSAQPYVSVDEVNDFFGTKKTTTGNKSKEIRDLLKLNYWDKEFSTQNMAKGNPYANLVKVNGFIVPIDSLPEEFQTIARQAIAEGGNISFTTGR